MWVKYSKEGVIIIHCVPYIRSLHTVNFWRCEHVSHKRQAWLKLQLALCLLLLTIPQLYPTASPSSSQQLFLPAHSMRATVCQLLYCTTALLRLLYQKIENVFFIFLCFLMYYLCVKYYKSIIVQYSIANCVSWVPRLTLLDSRTNWTYKRGTQSGTHS